MNCREEESDNELQWLTANSSTERLVDSLHPFYNYTCTVAAVTIAEGPFSASVTITTQQDGEHNFVSFVTFV